MSVGLSLHKCRLLVFLHSHSASFSWRKPEKKVSFLISSENKRNQSKNWWMNFSVFPFYLLLIRYFSYCIFFILFCVPNQTKTFTDRIVVVVTPFPVYIDSHLCCLSIKSYTLILYCFFLPFTKKNLFYHSPYRIVYMINIKM